MGAGPAGLHAALKAGLLSRSVLVVDKGRKHSRIAFAPRVDNIPGFPRGVSGAQLLRLQREHIKEYEKEQGRGFVEFLEPAEIVRLDRPSIDVPFELVVRDVKTGMEMTRRSRVVILATGVVDRQPYVGEWSERDIRPILPYANRGMVDYCLLCDGHLVAGKRAAVLGLDYNALGLAVSLRDQFHAIPTVVGCIACALGERHEPSAEHEEIRQTANEIGIPIVIKGIRSLAGLSEGNLGLTFEDGSTAEFDKGFMSLGWFKMNTGLAVAMGAATDESGYVKTTPDCEALGADGNAIPGLFAIGDIRAETWNQIPIALGDAETAVIHAHIRRL
ncbi:MAG: NAD(P)/FAD-dependent oxidoreductase [Euryarchaeota archaeon]|nr:NAD(P)/FAD-dependent oxidoreductase [Euryarchaeota archaeon]